MRMPRLTQTITYWSRGAPDGFGGYAWNSPVQIKGKWEERTEVFISPDGQSLNSRAVVFVDTDLEEGGYLYLGTSAASNPTTVDRAWMIMEFRKIPSVDGKVAERRAYL